MIIVPDGVLHTLPFHVLIDAQGQHLVEKVSLSYAPSVTALIAMLKLQDRRNQNGDGRAGMVTALALGRPLVESGLRDLPATEVEVNAIGRLFGTGALVLRGREATEERAREAMGRARYVHLAAHGLLNEDAPMYSAIALARGPRDDGLLHARELVDMDLRAQLVVLSACESALGRETPGEGILGLTWALFVAGTPSSILTLWKVADASTAQLMTAFYRNLRAGRPRSEALRLAQLSFLKSGQFQHPFYWAPFVLSGDWR